MQTVRLANAALLAASALALGGCMCSTFGGSFCAEPGTSKNVVLRDYRYGVLTDESCGGLVQMRVAGGDGAKSHSEVPATLFDYLELHAKTPAAEHPVADEPMLSLWLRRDGGETFYGYVVELRKGVTTVPHVACKGERPIVATIEYVTR
jgi:hypothetical protein